MKRQLRKEWVFAAVMAASMAAGLNGQTSAGQGGGSLPVSPTGPLLAPLPQVSNDAALPAGHPNIKEPGTDATAAATKGTLTLQVVAGTAGGTVAADEAVTVELYHRGSPLKKLTAKLDAAGKAVIPDLPVAPPVQALVSVTHAGLLQQVVSPELNAQEPNASIQMKVFDTTETQPEWNVAMQHLIVQWAADGSGAQVTEMISVNSPGDRAWLGNKTGDRRVTLSVPLPPAIENVELGGSFDEEASRIEGGKLVTAGALFPGRSEYRLMYTVAARNGALELPIVAPAAVESLRVFVPADGTDVKATGLTGGDAVDMGDGKIRMYLAQNMSAGQSATLSISGIKATAGAVAEAPPTASKMTAKNVAMGGAFLLTLLGAAMMMIKKPLPKKA